ncbi:MAG: hypothetical protein WD875_02410 [Pirellulales bacterium]
MAEPISPIHTVVHVGSDGLLNLHLPLNVRNADVEVTVNLKQVTPATVDADATDAETAAQEEWRRYVMESSGSIDDPTFFRHEQGELETREEFP